MAGDVRRRIHLGAIGIILAALALRFLQAGGAAFTFNEATYAELAGHPWHSSYYPDTLFLRHPPVAIWFLGAWQALFGTTEWVMRLPGFLATTVGALLVWHAVHTRAGDHAGFLAAVVMAASYPLHAYALQVSMYPFAFLFAAMAAWGHAMDRPRVERWGLVLFALSHLFGFLWLAIRVGRHWRHWRTHLPREIVAGWPAWMWLGAAGLLGLLVNAEGDVMRLGPLGQAARGGFTAQDAVADRPVVHLASAAVAWLAAAPLAWLAWRRRAGWPVWAAATLFILAYLPFGAPYPRYVVPLLPGIVVAGAIAWAARRQPRWMTPAVVAVALIGLPTGFAYLEHGPDPRAAGDVPGMQDWRGAVELLPANATSIATSGPTATTWYLGLEVTDSGEAPYRIPLQGGVTVWRLDEPGQEVPAPVDAWIVPTHWDAGPDAPLCAEVTGLRIHAHDCGP